MNLINKIIIRFFCDKIGDDEFGNSYYEQKITTRAKNRSSYVDKNERRRFVIYKGEVEASKVPAAWHGWLHYNFPTAPINMDINKKPWQKIHLPNLTGTIYHNSPSATADKKGNRKRVSSDYESWSPNNSN